jgi:acid phosphatase type 7
MQQKISWVAGSLLIALTTLAPGQQEKLPDSGPTSNLLAEAKPTFTDRLPKHWTIIAYGDMRFTDPANVKATNPKVRRWLVDKLAAEHPDALLLTGDVPWHGGVAADYAVYHAETAAWRDAGLRVYPALGNHELAPDATAGIANWWSEFPQLNRRRWYSVSLGDAYVLALDSNLPLTPGSAQQTWLDSQLQSLPSETRFVFVILHHPPVADNGPHERHNLRRDDVALADYLDHKQPALKARLIVVAGHTHNYEHFNHAGIPYLVSGGGGAEPYRVERDPGDLYRDQGFPNYHYVRFDFDGKKLTATMMRVADPAASQPTWEVKDVFTIDAKN